MSQTSRSLIKNPSRLFRKAKRLVLCNDVRRIGPQSFYVEAAHPDPRVGRFGYIVRIEESGEIVCGCMGFSSCGFCSHALAVAICLEQGYDDYL